TTEACPEAGVRSTQENMAFPRLRGGRRPPTSPRKGVPSNRALPRKYPHTRPPGTEASAPKKPAILRRNQPLWSSEFTCRVRGLRPVEIGVEWRRERQHCTPAVWKEIELRHDCRRSMLGRRTRTLSDRSIVLRTALRHGHRRNSRACGS